MPSYDVYGIHLQSNVEISGLAAIARKKYYDIEVDFVASLPEKLLAGFSWRVDSQYYCASDFDENNKPHLLVHLSDAQDFFHFQYATGVQFICDRTGTLVWGVGHASYKLDDVALYFLGPILGFMLRLRGITCLHASGIVIDGQVMAIVGSSGAGKSTLAAELVTAGYGLLTDDVMPLKDSPPLIYAASGYSRIKLWSEMNVSKGINVAKLPRLTNNWEKRYLDLAARGAAVVRQQLPLAAIYVLDQSVAESAEVKLSCISPPAALPLLAANTYRNELLDQQMRAQEFCFLAKLVEQVPVKQVCDYRASGQLCVLRDLLLDDFQAVS